MLHVSYALHLQTETPSMDMDDSDDKVIQNTDTQSNVSTRQKMSKRDEQN